jgi:hypothetical protein
MVWTRRGADFTDRFARIAEAVCNEKQAPSESLPRNVDNPRLIL